MFLDSSLRPTATKPIFVVITIIYVNTIYQKCYSCSLKENISLFFLINFGRQKTFIQHGGAAVV